MEDNFVSIE